jgi:hypothetical protein
MPSSLTFTVVLVTPQNAIGYGAQAKGTTVTYTGASIRTPVR